LDVVAGADGLPLLVYQTETQPVGDPSMGEMTGNLDGSREGANNGWAST